MLYTIPLEVRAGGAAVSRSAAAPTRDQINRATMNTIFSHIISPVNATCPISRDEFIDESEITLIRGCNHIFNRSSLREWFVSHSTCPMCRSDIREYQPPAVNQPPSQSSQSSQSSAASASSVPHRRPANLSIDSVDENHMTFSYDMPINYNNNEIYQDIVNTMNDMTSTINNSSHHAQYHYPDDDGDDDDDDDHHDDIMEVD